MKIGLMSDTHGFLDPVIKEYFLECDEIWHAGDIGDIKLFDEISAWKPFVAVYGNIDGHILRSVIPEDQIFRRLNLNIYMTHIGGYPGRYNSRAKHIIESEKPNLFITGHSHILKVIPDSKNQLLHINPGSCGIHGWHQVRTIVRFTIGIDRINDLEVIELLPRYPKS